MTTNIREESISTENVGKAGDIPEETVTAFRQSLRGLLLSPGMVGYDDTRQVWNGMINRRPAFIVRCIGASDVMAAVNFAREHDLLISVRGGGHNVAGTAVCDGGLMIDLSLMRGVRVDPQTRTVRVQGGSLWGDVDRETQIFGLAVPNGYVSSTGVAGFTLGGGYGALRRKYGLSCDSLLSVDIVTADGQLRIASDTENEDLFWAIRGGGGNFGGVTSFEFRCHPLGPMVFQCAPCYLLEQAGDVLRQWRDFTATAPDEISPNALLWTIPDIPDFPATVRGKTVVVLAVTYNGSPEEGEKMTRPLRQFAVPALDLSAVMPYTTAQSAFDAFFPHGALQYYWKAIHLNELSDEAIDTILEAVIQRPTPNSVVPIWCFDGAMSRVAPTATAFWHRSVPYMVSFDACWSDPTDAERSIHWARNSWRSMQKFSNGGMYVNFPGLGEEGQELAKAAYGANYERLVQVKTKYDPKNLFRMNQNIKPAAEVTRGSS